MVRNRPSAFSSQNGGNRHEVTVFKLYIVLLVAIILRLGYWQVIKHTQLHAAADDQYESVLHRSGSRGSIWTADGYALVTNSKKYRLFAQPSRLSSKPFDILQRLCPVLSTPPAEECQSWLTTLSDSSKRWTYLHHSLTNQESLEVAKLREPAIGTEAYDIRTYPEASMAAHIVGFVGKTEDGQDQGYFGVEGSLEHELKARDDTSTVLTDALGFQLEPVGNDRLRRLSGRDIVLSIRRDIQHLAETELARGMEQYGAAAGEIIIMDPTTGDILALAAMPSFSPADFSQYPAETYKNPSLIDQYEPGSTFKVLTVAAGIDAGVIGPSTVCPRCAGPRTISGYTIKTWNDQYNPNITMKEALAKSDNIAMIYAAELLGPDRMQEYLKNFGIGNALHIELQGDRDTPFPSRWGAVELATISFGQGITTSSLQLMRAMTAIANNGVMVRPRIVKVVIDSVNGEREVPVVSEHQVISAETARQVTDMMVYSASEGEAKWTASKTYVVAGKTGTSQIAAEGSYAADKTIASFIGFSPPREPKYLMLVKLTEPQSSPWAAETAAPLWYAVANQLNLLLNIQVLPDQSSSPTP